MVDAVPPPIPVSVVIPFHQGAAMLARAVAALRDVPAAAEVIVVANGSTEDLSAISSSPRVRVVRLPAACGPAIARNRGVALSAGAVIVFLDADVVPHVSAIPILTNVLQNDPSVAAVFGAYDHHPADPRFYSQYRNLAHAFVHEAAGRDAVTFWAGLGAIRREAFLAVGGFDERFTRASIEDIDLGYRLTAAGYRIQIEVTARGQHLRGWTLWSSIATDLRDRGVPWTQALIKYGAITRDFNLNVSRRGRAAVILAWLTVVGLLTPGQLSASCTIFAGGAFVWSQWPLLRWFQARRSPPPAVLVLGGQLVHHLVNGISAIAGITTWLMARGGWRTAWTLPHDRWLARRADEGYFDPENASCIVPPGQGMP